MFTDARPEQNQCVDARIKGQWPWRRSQGSAEGLMGRPPRPVSEGGGTAVMARASELMRGACNAQLCCRSMFRWIFHAPFSWCINNGVRRPPAIYFVTRDVHARRVACVNARTGARVPWCGPVICGIVSLSAAITFCQLWLLITAWRVARMPCRFWGVTSGQEVRGVDSRRT